MRCLNDVAINGVVKQRCKAAFSAKLFDLVPVPCVLTICIPSDPMLAVSSAISAARINPCPSSR